VHGARQRNSAPQDNHSYCRLFKELSLSPDRLRPVTLWEPPGADPHARWCGRRGRKTPAYPIGNHILKIHFQGQTPKPFLRGNLDAAFKYYERALDINPKHRGAHEYVGETYLLANNLPKAEEHLAALDKLCFFSCEEYRDLKAAIADYKEKHQH
jgi:tetratricopeptide (TPR) repeat protein